MCNKRWIAILLMVCMLHGFQFVALGEGNPDGQNSAAATEQGGINLNDIEINIKGVPIEDVIGTASGMFAEAFEENMNEAITGLDDIFSQFAEDFSADLEEIEITVGSMIEDTWMLKIPAISFGTTLKRSAYDNALDLYEAQISNATGKGARIAMGTAEGCGNNIIYVYDETQSIPAILEAVENETLNEREIIFGPEGWIGSFEVSAVLFLAPSDEPFAMCNMTDLSDERQFNAYRDYVIGRAVQVYDETIAYGDQLVTIIFWNEDEEADWLTVVAKEIPTMLE